MSLLMYQYLEVNLIGIALLGVMLFYERKRHDREFSEEQKHFTRMLLLNILILLADNGIYLLRGHGAPAMIFLSHVFCTAYYFMHGCFCYEWVCYVLNRFYPRCRLSTLQRWLLLLPLIVNATVTFASPFTGWVYTISAGNVYHRGTFVFVSFIAALLYWITSTVLVYREQQNPSRSREKGEYLALLVFPVFTLAGNLLQMCFYGLSVVWIFSALSMLILFADMQNEALSRDKLTGLFNRGQTNAQLSWEIDHLRDRKDLLLVVMFDLDNFKQINDNYGHLAGDEALILTAGVLKENSRKNDFASRFGGDEFLLIGHIRAAKDAELIINRIRGALREAHGSRQLPYPVSLSIGYAVHGSADSLNMDAVLAEADRNMYEEKRRNKLQI